jgi:hypothetical protein
VAAVGLDLTCPRCGGGAWREMLVGSPMKANWMGAVPSAGRQAPNAASIGQGRWQGGRAAGGRACDG